MKITRRSLFHTIAAVLAGSSIRLSAKPVLKRIHGSFGPLMNLVDYFKYRQRLGIDPDTSLPGDLPLQGQTQDTWEYCIPTKDELAEFHGRRIEAERDLLARIEAFYART